MCLKFFEDRRSQFGIAERMNTPEAKAEFSERKHELIMRIATPLPLCQVVDNAVCKPVREYFHREEVQAALHFGAPLIVSFALFALIIYGAVNLIEIEANRRLFISQGIKL